MAVKQNITVNYGEERKFIFDACFKFAVLLQLNYFAKRFSY